MKWSFFILIINLTLTLSKQENRLDLICKKWQLFGIKEFNKPFVSIDSSSILIFRKDGTFQTANRMYETTGFWQFNNDSTKITTTISKAKGVHLSRIASEPTESDSILRLTKDTLIYTSRSNTNWYYVAGK